MQDELLQLWDDTRFTVLFVTHSIPEAISIGNRILLLSPHPGQVKAEINSVPRGQENSNEAAGAWPRDSRDAVCRSDRGGAAMLEAVQRANIVYSETLGPEQFGIIQKPLTLPERIYNQALAAQDRHSRGARAGVGNLRPLARQPAAVADIQPIRCGALVADVANGDIPRAR